mmetsp:Transcript_100140/g.172911  ORF Transcript_100140/g.172911 Transcript_100140/m.172911 type:complete len:238 (-) Transcript_100140:924-1637(-)
MLTDMSDANDAAREASDAARREASDAARCCARAKMLSSCSCSSCFCIFDSNSRVCSARCCFSRLVSGRLAAASSCSDASETLRRRMDVVWEAERGTEYAGDWDAECAGDWDAEGVRDEAKDWDRAALSERDMDRAGDEDIREDCEAERDRLRAGVADRASICSCGVVTSDTTAANAAAAARFFSISSLAAALEASTCRLSCFILATCSSCSCCTSRGGSMGTTLGSGGTCHCTLVGL